ncbi:hypothetical protein AAFF_G00088720 [Aldrovandia affinis]|uniref:Uncharacterized protein n=1 Tax=Aldrovandia affinis TaxID=143900 RepID=A0AAD7RWI1_9TELE|nr:hypothetical protein AAFF_G00088720 [Aldrovandia affinis]
MLRVHPTLSLCKHGLALAFLWQEGTGRAFHTTVCVALLQPGAQTSPGASDSQQRKRHQQVTKQGDFKTFPVGTDGHFGTGGDRNVNVNTSRPPANNKAIHHRERDPVPGAQEEHLRLEEGTGQTVGLFHTLEQCLNRMQTVGLIHTLEQCLNRMQTVGLIHTLEQCLNRMQTVGLIHTLE